MNAPSLRIASYNLQKCVGLDLRRRPDRSLQVIEDIGAQVVVLQEADKRMPPRVAALPREMAVSCGWQVVDLGVTSCSLGWCGNAVLIRPGNEVSETALITLPGLEPRGAIRVDLVTPLGQLRIVGVHLGLIRRYRLMQLRAIMRHISHLPPLPTVLAGDFNEWRPSRSLDNAIPGFQLIPIGPSFPSAWPIATLDRFAISREFRVLDHGTHQQRPAQVASDHLPVWIELSLGEATMPSPLRASGTEKPSDPQSLPMTLLD